MSVEIRRPSLESLRRQVEINSTHINEHVAAFSSVFARLVSTDTLDEIIKQRPTLTPLHFGLLAQASCQYIYLQHEDEFRDLRSWNEILPVILAKHKQEMVNLITNRNISITNPRRYAVLEIITNLIFKGQPVTILDIGSGFVPLGIGVLLRKEDVPQLKFADTPTREFLSEYVLHNNNIQKIIATDIQSPDASWTAACSWLSLAELVEWDARLHLLEEASRTSTQTVEFWQIDITGDNISFVENFGRRIDLAMMSNLRYQLQPHQEQQAFNNISKILKTGGWLVSLEYMPQGSRRRPFTFGAYLYQQKEDGLQRTPYLLLRLSNADCEEILLGADFLAVKNKLTINAN